MQIADKTIRQLIENILPNKQLVAFELISGGCANLNFKLRLQASPEYYILRIYVRDPSAALREVNLMNLMQDTIPVACIYQSGLFEGFRYALMQYIPGITLRDLLLFHPHENADTAMQEAGMFIGAMHQYKFPMAGFLDEKLQVSKPFVVDDYGMFISEASRNPTVVSVLGKSQIDKICAVVEKYMHLLPDERYTSLVHGDYDPANILVHHIEGKWMVAAILDWEFAFSGAWLWDVSNMLRYAHHMPAAFKDCFLKGIKEGGLILPEQWESITHVFNLIASLYNLMQVQRETSPKRCRDIHHLIEYFVARLTRET